LIEEEAAAREQISQDEKLDLLVRKEKEVELGGIMESSKLQKEAEKKPFGNFCDTRKFIVKILLFLLTHVTLALLA